MQHRRAQRQRTKAPLAGRPTGAGRGFAIGTALAGLTGSVLALAVGCVGPLYRASADREVNRLLDTYDQRVLAGRSDWVQRPAPAFEGPPAPGDASLADTETPAEPVDPETALELAAALDSEVRVLGLASSLELAFTSSREFLTQQESLYLEGLGFTLTRHDFGPILNSTIAYVWTDVRNGSSSDAQSASLGMRQILPTGGTVSASTGLSGARGGEPGFMEPEGQFIYNATARVSLSQPLLRGAGYETSHESLTQGQRDLVYAVRSFELFRQDFSIRIAGAYFDLVSRKAKLANDEQNYKDAVFDRQKAEALRQVDRNQDDDVFLARRREIEAEDALLVARTDFEQAVDDFKILLGLPTAADVEIADEEPPFVPVRVDAGSAVEVALSNRLDLHTERDQLEDARRRVRLARQDLLPDLDVSVDADFAGEPNRLEDVSAEQWTAQVGVALELPLERKAERNAYRGALIGLDRTQRQFELRLSEVESDVRNRLRQLEQTEKRIQLQRDQIERERRAVAVTRIRYEAGDVDNRDLLDARQGLTNAQNALIDLKARHFIGRLQLQRDLGILFVDQRGMWKS